MVNVSSRIHFLSRGKSNLSLSHYKYKVLGISSRNRTVFLQLNTVGINWVTITIYISPTK
nr:MAG TPA: hypothetical protein [Bacteriophage sp.]